MPQVETVIGDCRTRMRQMPEKTFHTAVTSPPYFALRSYLDDDHPDKLEEIGQEQTPDEFVAAMAEVFRELHRVLRDDGTLWLNMGDTAASSGGLGAGGNAQRVGRRHQQRNLRASTYGLKRKDLIGIPWMLATALRDGYGRCSACDLETLWGRFPAHAGRKWCMPCLTAGRAHEVRRSFKGWYLRQEIIWEKPNCTPESAADRPTRQHEQIFLFAKSRHYHYDADAIAEDASPNTHARVSQKNLENQQGSTRIHAGQREGKAMKAMVKAPKQMAAPEGVKMNSDFHGNTTGVVLKRNKRTVWRVPTVGYTDSHYATFPPELIVPCIPAGAPRGGWVLDPFAGSGTTGQVAARLGRNCTLIDLDPQMERMAADRLRDLQMGLPGVAA